MSGSYHDQHSFHTHFLSQNSIITAYFGRELHFSRWSVGSNVRARLFGGPRASLLHARSYQGNQPRFAFAICCHEQMSRWLRACWRSISESLSRRVQLFSWFKCADYCSAARRREMGSACSRERTWVGLLVRRTHRNCCSPMSSCNKWVIALYAGKKWLL